jgi:hypothetical protein
MAETVPKSGVGVEHFLQQDGSPLSRQALSIIRALDMRTRLHFSAYYDRVLRRVLVCLILGAVFGAVVEVVRSSTLDHPNTAGLSKGITLGLLGGAASGVLAVLHLYLKVTTTTVTIRNARIHVVSGIFQKHEVVHDLWLIQQIELVRTLLNRITRDGTLVFFGSNRPDPRHPFQNGRITIRGLAKGDQLEAIYQQLQDLKFVLRANPVVKGVIQ